MKASKKAMDFLQKEQKVVQKVSVLEQYKEDIFYLKNNGVSITKILEFLEQECDVKTSYPNLLNWIKRQKEYQYDIKDETKNSIIKNPQIVKNNRTNAI